MLDVLNSDKRFQIGLRIQHEREKAGLTQEQLAEKVSVAPNTISGWENGKHLRLECIFALAQVFHCDCGYLLCDYDEPVHDMKTMADALGLSYDAIQNLRYVMKSVAAFGVPFQPYRQCADFLIASDYLRKLAVSMGDYETAYSKAIEQREKEKRQKDVVFIHPKDTPSYDNQYKSARNDLIELVFEITHSIEDAVEHPDG